MWGRICLKSVDTRNKPYKGELTDAPYRSSSEVRRTCATHRCIQGASWFSILLNFNSYMILVQGRNMSYMLWLAVSWAEHHDSVGVVQSTHRPHSYKKLAYISYAIILHTNTLNYRYCLDIDVRIGGRISPYINILIN